MTTGTMTQRALASVALTLVCGGAAMGGTSYVTDGNNLDLSPFDDAYDGTLASMASVTLDVPDSFTLADVDIVLDISHTWAGDLTIKLEAPDGTVVDLVSIPGFDEPADNGSTNGVGESSDLEFGFTYEIDDAALDSSESMGSGGENPIESFELYSSGFENEFGLTTLNGKEASGIWTLYVGDAAIGDTGILDGFTLILEAGTDGACCFDDGSCTFGPEGDCIAGGGIYQGDGVTCADADCKQPGACCFDDGSCTFGFQSDCKAGGGMFQGPGVTCADAACEQPGACCFDDGSCTFGFQSDCKAGGGIFQGAGVTCVDADCPQPGACCFDDGSCTFGFEVDCIVGGGTYQGDGVTCADADCPQPGACCFDDGSCTFGFESDCIAGGGTYQGDGVTCADADCPRPGACCFDDDSCTFGFEDDCLAAGGEFQGEGVTCADADCSGKVICLYDNGPPNGADAYSNGVIEAFGERRTLLDDFVVPSGGWVISDLHWEHVWDLLPAGSGTDAEISIRTDSGGQPGPVISVLTITNYEEMPTGAVLFDRPVAESWVDFLPLALGPGSYWVEATIVGPENNFWLTANQQNNECWVNYGGLLQSGTDQFGVASDINFCITGIGCDPTSGDVTGEGCVDFQDILLILGTWGDTGAPGIPGDANCDGVVNFQDILLVLGTWGQGCP